MKEEKEKWEEFLQKNAKVFQKWGKAGIDVDYVKYLLQSIYIHIPSCNKARVEGIAYYKKYKKTLQKEKNRLKKIEIPVPHSLEFELRVLNILTSHQKGRPGKYISEEIFSDVNIPLFLIHEHLLEKAGIESYGKKGVPNKYLRDLLRIFNEISLGFFSSKRISKTKLEVFSKKISDIRALLQSRKKSFKVAIYPPKIN